MTVVAFPFVIRLYCMAQLTFGKGDYPAGLASSPEIHLGLEVRDRKSGVKQKDLTRVAAVKDGGGHVARNMGVF